MQSPKKGPRGSAKLFHLSSREDLALRALPGRRLQIAAPCAPRSPMKTQRFSLNECARRLFHPEGDWKFAGGEASLRAEPPEQIVHAFRPGRGDRRRSCAPGLHRPSGAGSFFRERPVVVLGDSLHHRLISSGPPGRKSMARGATTNRFFVGLVCGIFAISGAAVSRRLR